MTDHQPETPLNPVEPSLVLAVIRRKALHTYYLILGCGHWVKWAGSAGTKPPAVDDEMRCPNCALPTVRQHD